MCVYTNDASFLLTQLYFAFVYGKKKKKRRSEPVDNMLQRQQQQHNNNGLVGVSINPAMYMMPHQGMYPQQGMQPNMDSNNNLIEMGKARTFVFQV